MPFAASPFELEACIHMYKTFCDADQFFDLIKSRFESQPHLRPAMCRLLASWVESRLVPDFFEPFTNRKGRRGDRQRYTYVQLLLLLTRKEMCNNVRVLRSHMPSYAWAQSRTCPLTH